MPRENLVVQIFLASPSDVADERAIVEAVVTELNLTWQRNLGVAFELIRWETNVRPGISEDAQAVINAQIPDDYDVFIGIFWSRLGTATSRAESGSVEEFERAFARWKLNHEALEIMIYIKDTPIPPSKLVGTQITSLEAFKEKLSNSGALMSSFKDQVGFETSLRAHLSAIAQKFSHARGDRKAVTGVDAGIVALAQKESTQHAHDVDDYGILDYLEVYGTRMKDMTEAAESIGEAIRRLGENVSERNGELNIRGREPYAVKRILKLTSDDMFRFAEAVNAQIVIMSHARQEAFSALSNALALMPDFPSDRAQLPTLKQSLLGNISAVTQTRAQMLGLEKSAAGLPRISKELNRGKRAAAESAARFGAELDSIEATVRNIVEAIDRLLNEP